MKPGARGQVGIEVRVEVVRRIDAGLVVYELVGSVGLLRLRTRSRARRGRQSALRTDRSRGLLHLHGELPASGGIPGSASPIELRRNADK